MKKHLLPAFIAFILILQFGFGQTWAQDNKTSKVRITITENDQVASDTTFELAEGQDPEMITKIVSHLAGGDVHTKHISQNVHADHKVEKKIIIITDKEGEELEEHTVTVHTDGDCEGKEKKIEVIVHSDVDTDVDVDIDTDTVEEKESKSKKRKK